MKPRPILSIIIISYNTKTITEKCIRSIISETKHVDYEIIVIDNLSTDGSPDMLDELGSHNGRITVVHNESNAGFGKANNQATKIARGTYILYLNSDTVVLNGAVDSLLQYYQLHEQIIHFLGGKLLNADNTSQPSCGPFYTLPVICAALFLKGDHYGLTRKSPNRATVVDWVSGACILTKTSYMEKVGGFDEDIFMYMEEIDLLYRAKQMGYQTWFYPDAQFIHLGSASSTGKTFPILQVYRGFLYFYKKHYGTKATFFLRILLQLKAGLAFMVGFCFRKTYLQNTYAQAFRIAAMD